MNGDDSGLILPALPTFTDRAVVSFEPDVDENTLRQFLDTVTVAEGFDAAPDFKQRALIFPKLKALVAPIPVCYLESYREKWAQSGVRSFSYERVSYAPPANVNLVVAQPVPSGYDPLDAMRVLTSPWSGGGIKIAMLDTGFDFAHPDFTGRAIPILGFQLAPRLPVQDLIGHGTHTTGLVCGPRVPASGAHRYGVAYDASVTMSRVTTPTGIPDAALFAGMTDAMLNNVSIVCMSLASPVSFGLGHSQPFEDIAKVVSSSNVLLIAAAGNSPELVVRPVEHPANCPSVMAVAALDGNFGPWDASCRQVNSDGEVNVSAPGFRILSAKLGGGVVEMSGTSMASAYAAGVAALWAHSDPTLRGSALQTILQTNVKRVVDASGNPIPPEIVGMGLIQAPQ